MDQLLESLPGRKVRGLAIGHRIGDGPRARIFRGEQISLRRDVALKVLRPEYAANDALRVAFLEAGRAAASLVHPNVIPIVTVVEEGTLAIVVEEYADMPTLANATSFGQPLPFQEVCQLALHALDVLSFIHAGQRRHGNLSPSNVFISDDGRYRLSDFYHSPVPQGEDGPIHAGPLEYVAPEIRLGGAGEPASDLYSLGMLLLHAATGAPPGDGTPPANVPPGFMELVQRLTEPAPRRRPAGAVEVIADINALRATARALGGPMSRPARADLPPPNRRRYHRLSADAAVQIRRAYDEPAGEGAVMESRLRDIGENGVFIATDTPLPVGTLVSLEFSLENSGRVAALGMVRWLARPPAASGMGVQFVEVSYPSRESLSHYIDGRMPEEARRILTATPIHRAILRALPSLWSRPDATLEEWSRLMDVNPESLAAAADDFIRLGLLDKTAAGRLKATYPSSRSLMQTIVRLAAEA